MGQTQTADIERESAPSKGRIRDARGRSVTQLDPVALHMLHRDEPIDRETLARVVGERGIGLPMLEKGALIAAVICGAAVIVLIGFRYYSGMPWSMLIKRTAPVLYLFVLPFIIWGGARKKRFGLVAAALLKHERCPHCGYDLRGLAADASDGATLCPECGCAWKLIDAAAQMPREHDT
jgi:hypothetical protein